MIIKKYSQKTIEGNILQPNINKQMKNKAPLAENAIKSESEYSCGEEILYNKGFRERLEDLIM